MIKKRRRSQRAAKVGGKLQGAECSGELWHVRIVAALCVLGFLIYTNSFAGSFHFDDLAVIVNNPAVRDCWDLGALFNAFNTRVIPGWTFAVNFALGQLSVVGYHFFNIWLHLCNAVLVYTLVHQLLALNEQDQKRSALHKIWIACAAALIFLVHPIQTQAVNYIWQRVTLCAVFFYLGTVVLYIHARMNSSRVYYQAALLSCLFAMFSKEITITLPLMLVLIEWLFLKRICADKRSWFWVFPFLLMLAIIPIMLQRSGNLTLDIMKPQSITRGVGDDVVSRKEYVLTQVNVVRTYVRMFFVPVDLSVDHDYPLASRSGWGVWFASLIMLLLMISAGMSALRRYPLVSFSVFWFFLTLSVESLVTSADALVEHRLYLPMVGLSLGAALALYQWVYLKNARWATVIIIFLSLLLGGMTFARNTVWQNDIKLWDDALQKAPRKTRSFNNRGVMFKRMNSFDLALKDFNRAIEIDPEYSQAYYNRGGIYKMTGDYDRALEDYAKVVQLEPDNAKAYDALGSIYRRKEMFDEALKNFTQSIVLNPYNPEIFSNRAYIYQKQGKDDLAIDDYTRAIKVDPGYVYAYNNRGNLYLKAGDPKSAVDDYNHAIEIQPQFAEAYLNRAVAKFQLGFFEDSRSDLKMAQTMGAAPKAEFVRQLDNALKK